MKRLKWLISAAVIVVLFATNPTMSQYTVWAVHMVETHAGGLGGALSFLFSGTMENTIAANTVRHNYGMLSLYNTTLLGHRFTVLGVFSHFIVLSHH